MPLAAKNLRETLRLLARLVIHFMPQDGRLAVGFLAHALEVAQRAVSAPHWYWIADMADPVRRYFSVSYSCQSLTPGQNGKREAA